MTFVPCTVLGTVIPAKAGIWSGALHHPKRKNARKGRNPAGASVALICLLCHTKKNKSRTFFRKKHIADLTRVFSPLLQMAIELPGGDDPEGRNAQKAFDQLHTAHRAKADLVRNRGRIPRPDAVKAKATIIGRRIKDR